jgi:hypothetical protein
LAHETLATDRSFQFFYHHRAVRMVSSGAPRRAEAGMTRKPPGSSQLLRTPAIIGGAVFFILALPVILPFVGVLHWRDRRRLRAAAKRLACQACGQLLGERAIEAADVAWAARLEHFQEKWNPVFRPKMRQNKELEPHSDSIGMEKAPERLRRKLPASIRLRLVRDLDAICTHCGARYEFMPQTREFVALKRAP